LCPCSGDQEEDPEKNSLSRGGGGAGSTLNPRANNEGGRFTTNFIGWEKYSSKSMIPKRGRVAKKGFCERDPARLRGDLI